LTFPFFFGRIYLQGKTVVWNYNLIWWEFLRGIYGISAKKYFFPEIQINTPAGFTLDETGKII
jgi:hypothetical protein